MTKYKFEVGDEVKILRRPKNQTEDPSNIWISSMDKHIGDIGKIISINPRYNNCIKIKGIDNWWFPAQVCELVSAIGTVVEEYDCYIDKKQSTPTESSGKFISEYPHKCPKCQAPAYISFMDKVDCSREGCSGE